MTGIPASGHSRIGWTLAIGAAVWLAAAGAGLWTVWAYDNQAGAPAEAPRQWPTDATIPRSTDRPTLILLAHPQCSCTSATLAELGEVLARATQQPRTYVLFLKPEGFPDGWERSSLWQTAASLPGVTVLRDDDGTQARQFGAETSGQVVLYDTGGLLRFSGGITGSRGHAGENLGRTALLSWLNHTDSTADRTDVFGCSLLTRHQS